MTLRMQDTAARLTGLAVAGVFATGGAMLIWPSPGDAHDELPAHHVALPTTATPAMKAFHRDRIGVEPMSSVVSGATNTAAATCSGGLADGYPCSNVDLQAFLALPDIGGTRTNSEASDIWGWTASDGSEYAIIGRIFGTSFIDISVPTAPVYLGELPTHGAFGSSWRDIKVHDDHAFIVSEALNHGMQVFDLNQLETMDRTTLPVTFAETAHYNGAAASHNVAINEASGFAYIVGASGKNSCSGGLHMVDINNPTSPSFAGCFSADGYTHDVQCVNYNGPDAEHAGKEICFAANEDTVTIVDVSDKANPVQLSRTPYNGAAYTHQGWLTDAHDYFVVNDELDEQDNNVNTTTYFFNVADLDQPVLDDSFVSPSTSIDHNLYMVGGCAIQANYRSGLRLLRAIDTGGLFEPTAANLIGYFDIWPDDDAAQFNGAWSNYPYFASGNIVVSGIEQGLYVLKPSFDLATACAIDSPTGNTAPVVEITDPPEGSTYTVGATVGFTAEVTDTEDEPDPVPSWTADTGEDLGSGSTVTWTPPVGTHTVTAAATDSGGLTGSDTVSITVQDTTGGPTTMDVAGLTGASRPANGRRVEAVVTVTIADDLGDPVDGATVSGGWSGGIKGGGSCVTDATGTCQITKTGKAGANVTFAVDGVSHPSLTYDPDQLGAATSVTFQL